MKELCPSTERPGEACEFAGVCHDLRQYVQQKNRLFGKQCWAFQQLRQDSRYPGNPIEPQPRAEPA